MRAAVRAKSRDVRTTSVETIQPAPLPKRTDPGQSMTSRFLAPVYWFFSLCAAMFERYPLRMDRWTAP